MSYDETWDAPHEPTKQPCWQESDCWWAYDHQKGVGLFYRVGQYVNEGTGQVHLLAFKRGGRRFKLVQNAAQGLRKRSKRAQQVGSFVVDALGSMRMRYRWDETNSSGDLEFYESFYVPRNWHTPESHAQYDTDMHDGGHLECSGRLRGKVRIGGEVITVDALAHRDRSWGNREVGNVIYQHRMCTGTIGPDLSWATVLVQFNSGELAKMGFVARNGVTEDLSDIEIFTTVDYDSLSVRGSVTRLHLREGEVIEIEAKTEQGFLNQFRDYAYGPDVIMSVDYRGKKGFTYLTASINPAKGDYVPSQQQVRSLCVSDGLSDFVSVE